MEQIIYSMADIRKEISGMTQEEKKAVLRWLLELTGKKKGAS